MNGGERIASASVFEDQVKARICSVPGWVAVSFGQALLSVEARDALKLFEDLAQRPTLVRWMPDLLAWRTRHGSVDRMMLLDAKVGQDSANHAVEIAAVDAMSVYVEHLYHPTFFVFNDWTVLSPRVAKLRGDVGPPPRAGHGSGTPYLLVPKQYARPFDLVFEPTRAQGV